MLRRRAFITGLAGASALRPRTARPDERRMPIIGYVGGEPTGPGGDWVAAFEQGLGDTGFTVGGNVSIVFSPTEGHIERLPRIMVDLVRHGVSAIFTAGGDVA